MSEDRIETTDAFDSLPLDIYVSCVLDRTRVLAGFVHPEFWSDQRINRVKNRWLNLRQAPEQVAQDMADEHRMFCEISGDPREHVTEEPQGEAYRQTMDFLRRTQHHRPWEKRHG